MERLTIKYEGLFTPKKACTIDRFGEADDCDSCDVICDSTHGSDCANCVIQECFTRLGEYENTGLTPEQIRELKQACFTRLGEYENTGLTPEQIRELKERDTAKAPKICKNKRSDAYTCPNCNLVLNNKDETGWFCGKHYKFCPDCGQRIRWED